MCVALLYVYSNINISNTWMEQKHFATVKYVVRSKPFDNDT